MNTKTSGRRPGSKSGRLRSNKSRSCHGVIRASSGRGNRQLKDGSFGCVRMHCYLAGKHHFEVMQNKKIGGFVSRKDRADFVLCLRGAGLVWPR